MDFDDSFYIKRRRDNYIRQSDVIHKSKKISFWCEGETAKLIEGLAKELNQSDSKVIKDILEDFFLEAKLKEQEFEPDWDKSELRRRFV
jgi:hypothetical protein